MTKQTYGNNDYISFAYDSLDRLAEKSYNNRNNNCVAKKQYLYGNDGNISVTVDFASNSYTRYNYDLSGRTASIREYSGTDVSSNIPISYTEYKYADKTNYLTNVKHFSPIGTQNIAYKYGNINNGEMPDQVYSVSWNGVEKVTNKFDSLSRLSKRTVNGLATNYTYKDIEGNQTTMLVKSIETAAGTFTYTYDEVGNIKSVSDGTYTTSYDYDALNQLVRENNQQIGKTYTYAYQNGNITERKEYAYTTGDLGEVLDTKTWTYGNNIWTDLLTNFNGQTITYDEIGNPTTIGNKSLSWNGRQLQQIADGENIYTYSYNADGQRVSKTVTQTDGTVTVTEFFYNGSILAGQKTGNNTLVFMYDNNGDIFGVVYNGAEYYYIKNAQNDVVAIVDSNKNVIAEYQYDAWGRIVSVTDVEGNDISAQKDHIGNVNPIRYRSYYFDSETYFYYLNTRYYSPEMCRFLNADDTDTLLCSPNELTDKNLFAYCDNNPVMRVDHGGDFWMLIGAAVGAVVGGAVSAISQYTSTGKVNWGVVGVNAAAGAISGVLASTGVGLVASVGINAALGGGTYVAEQAIKREKVTVGGVVASSVAGGIGGAIGGRGANAKGLSAAWKSASKGISRELRRANVKYATKQIAKYTVEKVAVKTSTKIAIGRLTFGAIGNAFARWKFGY